MALNRNNFLKIQAMLKDILPEAKRQSDNNFRRFERIDRYLEKATDLSRETAEGEAAARQGNKKIVNVEIPIVHIKHQTALAFMAGTFLSGYPIFAATAHREMEDGAAMLNVLTGRDQQRLGWTGELLRTFDDALRRNLCAAEVNWVTRRGTNVSTGVVEGATKTGAVSSIIYEGVEIKRLDPYNTFMDPMVEPSKVHSHGNFVGYVECVDAVTIKRRFQEFDQLHTYKENISKFMSGEMNAMNYGDGYTNLFRVPQISKTEQANDPTNFTGFFGSVGNTYAMQEGKGYEWVVMYKRMAPADANIDMPNRGSIHIIKMVWINGYICYAEPLTLGHEYLPIIVGQMYPGDHTKKSFCEYLTDLQDLGTGFMTASLNAMRRAVADRALYDPTRIKKSQIESDNPTAKIPVTGNMFQKGLADAYYQIPFEDRISGNMQSMVQVAMQLADVTTGINPSTQGAFTPGNKTVAEYSSIQSNSEARLQLGALTISTTFLAPIKEIVKLLYLINSTPGEVTDEQTNTKVAVDPAVLREQSPNYMMADGLMPTTKIANTEVLMQSLAVFQNNPMLALEYDIGGITVSVLKQQGFNNLNEYKRTPEQQQQYMAMMQQQQPAEAGAPQ